MVQVQVIFLDGKAHLDVSFPEDATIALLRKQIEQECLFRNFKLVSQAGEVLSEDLFLVKIDLGDKIQVTCIQTKDMTIYSSWHAFAAVKTDGSVVTWGDAGGGGNSSAVQDQLVNIQQIFSTRGAFAALKTDGSVVTWGDQNSGGNSSVVQDQLLSGL